MGYLHAVTGILSFLAGGILVFIIFYKKILTDTTFFNSFERNSKDAINKVWYEFYARLSTHVDLSEFKNGIALIEIERKRISMDIHDELASHISALAIDLHVISMEGHLLSPHCEKRLLEMRTKLKHTTEAIRKIIFGLMPSSLEMGTLDDALAELCRTKEKIAKGTSLFFRTSGQRVDLKYQNSLYIYRIVQELINNSLKHSQAWHIFITVLWTDKNLEITARDNGKGLPDDGTKTDGNGIKGIFVRSQVIGATAEYSSVPSGGTVFKIVIPLKQNRADILDAVLLL